MNDRSKLQELIAERARLNNEINKLKHTQYAAPGVKVTRYGTGILVLRIRPDDEPDGQFRAIARGNSVEDLIVGTKRIIGKLNAFCEATEEQIEGMTING